jgi:dienelactone hydrolase
VVLNMARMGADLQGVVSFHGNLQPITPAKPGVVKAKVLVLNGADDPFVPVEQRTAFKAEMDAAGVDYEFIDYPGAVHSFTSKAADAAGKEFNLPLAYNAEADADSWQRMLAFFGEIFAIPPIAE